MRLIPDDPIVACIERTGYPPWMQNWHEDDDYAEREFPDDDEDEEDEGEEQEA